MHGNVLLGEGTLEATAVHIHARPHMTSPRVGAAFRTHMPNAAALDMVEGEPFVWARRTALKFYGLMAADHDYGGRPPDAWDGDRLAAALCEADILFMRNHGVMACAPNIAEAWDDLHRLERAAEAQLKAMSDGRRLLQIPEDVARGTSAQMREGDPESAKLHMAGARRPLDRAAPDRRD